MGRLVREDRIGEGVPVGTPESGSDELGDVVEESLLGLGADNALHWFAVLEQDQCRNRHDLEASGDIAGLVDEPRDVALILPRVRLRRALARALAFGGALSTSLGLLRLGKPLVRQLVQLVVAPLPPFGVVFLRFFVLLLELREIRLCGL